jgi:Zn-dependent M28 family amino/carboxypeptidase
MKATLQKKLYTHLEQITRERDPYVASGGHFLVKQYIKEELSQWGEVTTHDFQVKGNQHQNLILNLPSKKQNKKQKNLPPILIGAHYDGVPGTPGADDNATGVAVLLELAAYFAANPPKYPVKIVAFDMEEYGRLGSFAYANHLKSQQQPLRLMISLEMLGYCDPKPNSQRYPADFLSYIYPNQGNFIALVGNLITIPDLIRFQKSMQPTISCQWLPVPNNGKWIPGTSFSDHSPFWLQGYRAMMVTDTAFLRNPHYHKPTDTIDTVNENFLTAVYYGLIDALNNF